MITFKEPKNLTPGTLLLELMLYGMCEASTVYNFRIISVETVEISLYRGLGPQQWCKKKFAAGYRDL